MADSSEPKKDTVRITVSPTSSSQQLSSPVQSRETVRIHLPSRPPANPPESQSTESPSATRTAAAAMPAPMTMRSPKKETVRTRVLPNPRPKPAVEMKKTQPLIDLSAAEVPAIRVEPQPVSKIVQIPMSFCWGLLGAAAAILILQIWNYLS